MSKRMTESRFCKQLLSTALGLFIVMASVPASAIVVPLFGPQQFVRTEGKPSTIVRTFQVPAEAIGCRLLVKDGAGGPASANNVSVKVNGIEMVNAMTLRTSDPAEAEVDLQASNILVVTLKGKPGDQITVEILGEIPDPPSQEPPPRPEPPSYWPPDRPAPPGY